MDMNEKRVLLAEDDEVNANIMITMLEQKGYTVDHALDGTIALDLYKKYRYHIVITDLSMPNMDGNTLIGKIKSIDELTVIIIITGKYDSETIVKSMKQGVYDYLIKPIKMSNLEYMVKRAFEYAKLIRTEKSIEKQKQIKLEQQLDWYRWEEKIKNKQLNIKDHSLFSGLKEGFSQGAGLGTLITILELILTSGEEKGDEFIVDKTLINHAKENLEFAKKGLEIFTEIDNLEKNNLVTEQITIDQVYSHTENILAEIDEFRKKNNNTFLLSNKKEVFIEKSLNINISLFKEVIIEVIKNALKFSQKESEITVIFDMKDNNLKLSILNQPKKNENGSLGIPYEYENLVFEPFFRINKSLNEAYETLEFGIGLTLAEKIIKKHSGNIRIFNIKDYSDLKENPLEKVCLELIFPLHEEAVTEE